MADTTQVQGLPPGAVVGPDLAAPASQVEGLPPGAVVGPNLGSSAPAESMLSKAAGVAGDVATGFAKGAGDTVSGIGHLINKIPVVGETLSPSEGLSAMDTMDTSKNTAQSVGKGVEDIAEFAAGDEALDGIAHASKLVQLAQKYPLIAKTLTLATEHPWLAKIITEGAKGAGVGAVQGTVKGAQQGQAVKGAETGAEVGGATGATIGAVKVASSLRVNPFRAVKAVAESPRLASITGSDIQPTLQSGLQDVWTTVAKKAGVAPPVSKSIQDAGEEVADNILARSKANYRLIDEATDGRFSGTESALNSVNRALRSVTNDTEEQALMIRKTRFEMQMGQMMDDAEKQGVPKTTVDAAKSDFKQAQAIYDTNHQIRMSTTGVRPGMKGASDVPEEVDPKKLMNRLNKLYNSGRLQEAVGDDGAEDLIGHSATAQKTARTVARNQKIAAIAVPAAAGVAGTAYELTK